VAAADGGWAPGRFELGMRVRKADGQQFLAANFSQNPIAIVENPFTAPRTPAWLVLCWDRCCPCCFWSPAPSWKPFCEVEVGHATIAVIAVPIVRLYYHDLPLRLLPFWLFRWLYLSIAIINTRIAITSLRVLVPAPKLVAAKTQHFSYDGGDS